MEKTKKCKHCQSEIDKKAKICPNCRMKQKNNAPVIIAIICLIVIGAIYSQGNKPTKKVSGNKDDAKQATTQNAETPEEEIEEEIEEELSISVGDTIKTDDMEVTIKKIEFSYDVLPDDTSGFYTHYEADKGNVYIHIDTDVKNIAKQNLSCDEILTVKADYNDGYTYNSQAVPEDTTTGFTYANITSIKPLETLGVRFIIGCPQEVEESENSLSLYFQLDGTKDVYKYNMR